MTAKIPPPTLSYPPPTNVPDPVTVLSWPPAMVAPPTDGPVLVPEPPTTLGVPPPGSNRKARVLFTQSSSGTLSTVPRKSDPGTVPALPVSDQPAPPLPALATVRVLPLGVMVTFAPADKVTASAKPLRLLTTCPGAMPAPVTDPAATPFASAAMPAETAAPALEEKIA